MEYYFIKNCGDGETVVKQAEDFSLINDIHREVSINYYLAFHGPFTSNGRQFGSSTIYTNYYYLLDNSKQHSLFTNGQDTFTISKVQKVLPQYDESVAPIEEVVRSLPQ